MAEKNKNRKNQKNILRQSSGTKIQEIGITRESLTGRGGMAFIIKYIKNINVISVVSEVFKGIRKSRKGKDIETIIEQMIYNSIDGSKQTMTRFDELKEDGSYLKTIEINENEAVSSHSMKRFFKAVNEFMLKKLQKTMLRMFVWRLKITKPEIIILGADTMVLNNNDAHKREGVSPTYKMVKGYHPLFIYWGRFVVNMIFHEGKDHPNRNNDYFQAIRETIAVIRKEYREEVPILVLSDAGFYDQKYFQELDEQEVFFICGGKLMDCVKMEIMKQSPSEKLEFERNGTNYDYLDFIDKRESWQKAYRAIYYKQADINGEFHLEFDRPETLVYTNLEDTELLKKYQLEKYLDGKEIVALYQSRAKDELVNRSLKEFAEEALPFQRFISNAAYYYLTVIAKNLLTAFQEDILSPVIPMTAYPNTVRRLFIDIAGKIVCTARKIILKFEQSVYERLKLPELWIKCLVCVPV
jgi:hypothetical protein